MILPAILGQEGPADCLADTGEHLVAMEARQTVLVPGSLSGIRQAEDAFEAFSAAHRVPHGARAPFHVALDEVLSNIVTHGFGGSATGRQIEVEFRLLEGVLEVTVTDDAPPFNPLEAAEPDTAQPLEERPVGGLGILLIKRLMDAVEYERREGRNRLVFSKRIGT